MTVDDFEPGPQLVTSAGVPGCSSTAPNADAVRFDPAWRTSTVLAIAADIMERGNFDAMPILADALQDTDCDNTTLLEHCRCGMTHTKRCWVLPLILDVPPAPAPTPPIGLSILVEAANRFNEPSHTPSSFEKRSAALIVVVVFGFFVWIATRVNSGWPFTYDERLLAVTVAIVLPAVLIGTFVLVQYCYAVARVRRERRDNTP